MNRILLPLALAVFFLVPALPASAAAPRAVPAIHVVRDQNLETFPRYEIRNDTAAPLAVVIASSLESTEGTLRDQITATHTLAPRATGVFSAYAAPEKTALRGDIALLRSVIALGDRAPETESAIVGSPKPVARDGDYFIGMNVHLERYTAEEQWRLLRMMRAAGVRSIRNEPGFHAPGKDGTFPMSLRIEQAQLATEAYGMNSLFALTFFNAPFQTSAEKAAMAYGWARAVGEHYKGRVFDYQYGNETNSGWNAYGAAADMAAHNEAMALGSLAADPANRPATLGIAEADPSYLREMLRSGVGPYLKAVTLHPYCGVAEAGVAKLEADRSVIAEFGGHQEIWATEVGFHFDEGGALNPTTRQLTLVNGFTRRQQADQLARLYLLSRAKGIERVYWYDFFGKNDRETFWLVDENFNPTPAYRTLKFIAPYLNDSTPLGGTASTEPVQRQLFRRPDGSVFLAAWALRDGVSADLRLPPGDYVVHDTDGRPLKLDLTQPVMLGERPLLIDGLPSSTLSFAQLGVLADTLDRRPFTAPMSRWEIAPGETATVPCVVFNSQASAITAHPVIVTRMPGWQIELPPAFDVPAGETVARSIKITAPRDAVPGVEYRFSFAVETTGPRRTVPCEARIWLKGKFPYAEDLLEKTVPDYPVRRAIDESKTGFGRPELAVRRAPATFTPASIDGDLTDWDASEFVTLDQRGNWLLRDALHPMREDAFVRAALRWDDQYLYVAWLVTDDDLSLVDLISRDWRDSDNVRVFLSAEADPKKRTKTISPADLLVEMVPTRQFHDEGPAVLVPSLGGYVRAGAESQIKIASRVWHGGWLVEAAIPFSLIGVAPQPGQMLGCNLLSDDADHGFRKSASMTRLLDFNYWNSPASLGQLRLLPAQPDHSSFR